MKMSEFNSSGNNQTGHWPLTSEEPSVVRYCTEMSMMMVVDVVEGGYGGSLLVVVEVLVVVLDSIHPGAIVRRSDPIWTYRGTPQ